MKGNRLVKDSFLILFTNCITYLSAIVNTRIISGSFSLTDYGYRAQILSIVAIIVSVFSLGFSSCPNYFIPLAAGGEKNAPVKIVRNLYLITSVICTVMCLIVWINYGLIANYFANHDLFRYRCIILIMAVEQIFYSFYNGIQVSEHRALRATVTNLIRTVFTIFATIVSCIVFKSMYVVIVSTLLVDCTFCIYTIIDSSRPFCIIGKWIDPVLVIEMAKYCIPLGISSITAGLCTQIDKLFVARFFSPDDLAVYSNMCTELPLAAISGAFIAVISPYVVKFIKNNKPDQAIELWRYVVEFVAIILFSIVAGLFTFSKQAVYILYSEKYIFGYQLFRVFVLVEISRITYFGLILRSYGKSMQILMCSSLTLVLDVILNAIAYFVFRAGLMGFAIATMISTFSIQLLQLMMSCRVSGVKFKNIFPWRRLGKIAAINILFILCFSLLLRILDLESSTNILLFIPFLIIWIAVYFMIFKRSLIALYSRIRNTNLYGDGTE